MGLCLTTLTGKRMGEVKQMITGSVLGHSAGHNIYFLLSEVSSLFSVMDNVLQSI